MTLGLSACMVTTASKGMAVTLCCAALLAEDRLLRRFVLTLCGAMRRLRDVLWEKTRLYLVMEHVQTDLLQYSRAMRGRLGLPAVKVSNPTRLTCPSVCCMQSSMQLGGCAPHCPVHTQSLHAPLASAQRTLCAESRSWRTLSHGSANEGLA